MTADTNTWPRLDVPEDEERIVRFVPAYHRCNKGGIGSVRMVWVLRVGEWAVGWDVSTGWDLPDEAFHAAAPGCTHHMHQNGSPCSDARGGAVDWHCPTPRYDEQQPSQDRCPITETVCYSDVGFIIGDVLFDLLRVEGDEAVWTRLRELLEEARQPVEADA